MAPGKPSGNHNLCPHCQQPLSPGVKFCESCGAKADAPAPCPYCGHPLSPGVKFCETCGKAIPPAPAPGAATIPGPVPGPVSPPGEPAESAAPPGASPEPVAAEPEPEKTPHPEPEQAPVPEPPLTTPATAQKKDSTGSKGTATPPSSPASGISPKTLILAGVIGVVVIAALAWFVLLPLLSGAGMAASGNGAGPAGTVAAPTDAAVSSPQTASPVSFDPQPVQRLPVNLEVTYQVERDPRNGIVTVTFSGGPGLNGIAGTLIRVTRSDGQVLEKSWKPARVGDSTTVQGTMLTDRVEVITNFYNGDSYRCFDEIFEYKKRN